MTPATRARLQELVEKWHNEACKLAEKADALSTMREPERVIKLRMRAAQLESDTSELAACLAAEGEAGNPLQSELLDLIKLMPDAQVDEILSYVATLREARRLATETRSGDIGRAESAPPSGEIKPEA